MNPPDNGCAIRVTGLRKSFGELKAVDGVEFEVRAGEVFGFLGPNGAGKTTTINILTGLARADSGSLEYFGRDYSADIKPAQHLMGIVPDESNLYPELSGRDNLLFCAALYGLSRAEREERACKLLDEFGLAQAAGRKFATYSKGMKRKLTIAAGLIHSPKILFLDEPTTGIDVASARQIRTLLSGLNKTGATIFLTTHYIEEAERLCGRIAFIVGGRIVRLGPLEELMSEVAGENIVEIAAAGADRAVAGGIESGFPEVRAECIESGRIRLHSKDKLNLGPFFRHFDQQGLEITEARLLRPSLEDVFVRITGLELDKMRDQPGGGGKGGGR
jgi:ABC-2 type transport system ATP-binding protein